MNDFQEFPKLHRLSRECVITEKIDGTNAQVHIIHKLEPAWAGRVNLPIIAETPDTWLLAGSRNRYLTLDNDNFGFARWCHEHAEELFTLGVGRHFGEWWGLGIQRGYGLKEKRFSLFNTHRWCLHGGTPERLPVNGVVKYQDVLPPCVGLVPVLSKCTLDTHEIDDVLHMLKVFGSKAVPGYMNPEGIVIYHTQGNVGFKKTLGGDGHKDHPQARTYLPTHVLQ